MKFFIYCAGGLGREIADMAIRLRASKGSSEELLFIDDIRSEAVYNGLHLYSLEAVIEKGLILSGAIVIANGEPREREKIRMRLDSYGVRLAKIIDPTAIISPFSELSEGAIIGIHTYIANNAVLMSNVVVNTGSMVGHDVIIGMDCSISSCVNIAGNVCIGERTYIGMGTQVREHVNIGKNVIIGMGSVVTSDIPDDTIALGNPARVMKKNVVNTVFKC